MDDTPIEPDKRRRNILMLAADIFAAVVILYLPYYAIWGHYHPDESGPMKIQTVLLLSDILPCAAANFWLIYRYAGPLNRSPLYNAIQRPGTARTLFFLSIVLLVIIAKTFWR